MSDKPDEIWMVQIRSCGHTKWAAVRGVAFSSRKEAQLEIKGRPKKHAHYRVMKYLAVRP
jgi:hypothetical protein